MSLDTDFNVNPYYDDYNEDKKFLRILFKPGYAVQARELTQLQTILQKQVERFGNHIFKNGSVVTGGQFAIQDATYIKLDAEYAGSTVSANNFSGKTIVDNVSTPTKRAEVIKVYDANSGTGDPRTLMVKQIFGSAFTSSSTIYTTDSTPVAANISTSGVGTGQTFSVNEGVFFYDGFFIKNDAQSIATSKYNNNTANARIGFEITETLVTSVSDSSLLDPAQLASNYQAPGSDRFKITLTLATRSLDSTDDTKFIELARVENGVLTKQNKYPLYSVLEDTLARRTFDESGNYTVRQFNLNLETNSSNTAQTNIILSPGKAYVYGYEFESIAPTVLTVPKPRTTSNVSNKRVSADYGNYIYTTNHYGTFPTNSLSTVDLHCAIDAHVASANTGINSNTKVGTARVKTIEFDSASDTSNANTYIYRTYLFDVNIGSLTGTVQASGNSTHVNIGTGKGLADNIYNGSRFRITSGPGSTETYKIITNYNRSTGFVAVDPFTTTPTTASSWSIDFEMNDVKSLYLADGAGTTRLISANVSDLSKNYATTYGDTYLTDVNLETLIFPLGQNYIANNTLTNLSSFSYKRLFESQTFSGNSKTLSPGSGESLTSATTTTAKLTNYQIIPISGTSTYALNRVIDPSSYSVSGSTITVTSGGTMTANIIATIDVSNLAVKAKTYRTPNTAIGESGRVDIFSNNGIFLANTTTGQTHISSNNVIRTPGVSQSLYVSDVASIVQILDFGSNHILETNRSGATDVTSRYTLDTGQRNSFYDHASIKLKAGQTPPTGNVAVFYRRFTSSGAGVFSVDSYQSTTYDNIPSYTDPISGTTYNLRDCLDFRPVRADVTVAGTGSTVSFDVSASSTGPKIPQVGSDIVLSYEYYLPRIDKVVLSKNRQFEVVQGIPSLTPVQPADKNDSMTLYVLSNPAYLANPKGNTVVQYVNNKRYTMRDIGTLEKRVENIEYYSALSLLEQSTFNKSDLTILDSQNLPRFKNGIIVDSFDGQSIADVENSDFKSSIDSTNKELRPSFNISSYSLLFDSANSSNYTQNGSIISVATSNNATVLIDQPKASKAINVNPFNVINYLGFMELDPKSDIWVDTTRSADVLVNITGDNDAWALIAEAAYKVDWGAWQQKWTGTRVEGDISWRGWLGVNGTTDRVSATQTVFATGGSQSRTGISSSVVPTNITQRIGDRIIDVSVIPYMRQTTVLLKASNMKPDANLYPYFDNTDVKSYVARANRVILQNNNLNYRTTTGNPEVVTFANNITSTTNGSAFAVLTSNNSLFVVSVSANTGLNFANGNLIGSSTGTTVRIAGYEHFSGMANNANSSTIGLSGHADSANNIGNYNGATIYIVAGTGAGQSATINYYNPATRNVSISGTWTTTPVANDSIYSIGNLTATRAGDVAGVFTIPKGVFRTGEKTLRLTDTSSGDVPSSTTSADASFYAQGLIQNKQDTIISATVPTIVRGVANQTEVIPDRVISSTTAVIGYWDPLAQTFLISPIQYPQGVNISKVRLCFKTKDTSVPITLQIRPATNGYPSSSVIYPSGSVTLTPDKINTTTSPNLDDATKYTDFIFDAPIYLQPGEHSFVILANSNKYEVYIAQIGTLDLVNNRQISEQPYGGSLFLSQNGSTWTADQNSDMMFRIFRNIYSNSTSTVQFLVNKPTSNVSYDVINLINSDLSVKNTSVSYQFSAEKSTGGMAGFKQITPLTDYSMTDGDGRRVLNPTTGNTTLIVKATMSTLNPAITPQIDVSRFGGIFVENIINNLPLSNSMVYIANTGSGMADGFYNLSLTGGNGSGAVVRANVISGRISRAWVEPASEGSGYTTSPTINLFSSAAYDATGYLGNMCVGGSANGASIIINGDDKTSGGASNVRYVLRKVTLKDGFDSGDLRVYLTANIPSGSNVYVYYKLLSVADPDVFDNKNYQLMTQITNTNYLSTNENEYRELTFAPGIDNTANNSVSYTSGSTSFTNFRTFSIKVVLAGTDTVSVPKVRDLRVIALPAG